MGIHFSGPVNSLSYGICGLNILKELSKLDLVGYWPIGNCEVTSKEDANVVNTGINNQIKCGYDDPCLRLYHQFSLLERVGKGSLVGYPIFELNKFNNKELYHLKGCDKLAVTSEWAKQILIENGIKCPIKVCPLGVDRNIFKEKERVQQDKFIILVVGKLEFRKLHDQIPTIFSKAFNQEDNVELWMACTNIFNSDEENKQWMSFYNECPLANKIRFLPRFKTQQELANIYSLASIYLGISRAEGWGLGNLEAMSCGLPVITTNVSAHTEYCDIHNSWLVPITKSEPAYDNRWFHGQGDWASFEEEQVEITVEHLRKLYRMWKYQGRWLCINENGIETAKKFSWKNTAEKLKEFIND